MFFILTRLRFGKRGSFFLPLFLILFSSQAQVDQVDRFEVQLGNNERHFDIIASESNGLYLYRRFTSNEKDDQLQIVKLDTAFQQDWAGFMPVDRNYVLVGQRTFKNKLYLLTRFRDFSRNNFYLYVVGGDDGTFTRFEIRGFIPFSTSEFQVTDHGVLIGGYYNRVPFVVYFSLKDYRSKVLPGLFNDAGELTHIRPYDDGSFDVLISAMNFKRQRTIWLKNYDSDGNLMNNFALEPEDNKHLIFGRSIKTQGNVQLVAGVYGTRSAEYSRGVFIARIEPNGLQTTQYYNFADLENFFKYMKAKREKRVKSRIERRKVKGKKIRFNYRFLVHELVPYQDQYILLGEAFYPKYITTSSYNSGFFNFYSNGGRYIRDGRIFDGYYYTHAVVMGFDKNARLIWDNSFEINDVRTFTLEQFVKLEVQDDKVALFYLFDNEIRTKIIKNNTVLEGKTADPIRTKFQDEIVRKTEADVSKLEYWYDGYLYAYGVQELEKTSQNRNKRRVFYINKVRNAR